MDVASALARVGIPRYPPSTNDVVAVIGWLPLTTPDGKPLTWTRADACRFLFYRHLRRTGRLSG